MATPTQPVVQPASAVIGDSVNLAADPAAVVYQIAILLWSTAMEMDVVYATTAELRMTFREVLFHARLAAVAVVPGRPKRLRTIRFVHLPQQGKLDGVNVMRQSKW